MWIGTMPTSALCFFCYTTSTFEFTFVTVSGNRLHRPLLASMAMRVDDGMEPLGNAVSETITQWVLFVMIPNVHCAGSSRFVSSF